MAFRSYAKTTCAAHLNTRSVRVVFYRYTGRPAQGLNTFRNNQYNFLINNVFENILYNAPEQVYAVRVRIMSKSNIFQMMSTRVSMFLRQKVAFFFLYLFLDLVTNVFLSPSYRLSYKKNYKYSDLEIVKPEGKMCKPGNEVTGKVP